MLRARHVIHFNSLRHQITHTSKENESDFEQYLFSLRKKHPYKYFSIIPLSISCSTALETFQPTQFFGNIGKNLFRNHLMISQNYLNNARRLIK